MSAHTPKQSRRDSGLHEPKFSYSTAALYSVLILFLCVLGYFGFTFEKHDKDLLQYHYVDYNNPDEAYWGPPTAAINWCEDDYQVSPYIAEFWNTMTSGALSFGGLVGMALSKYHGYEPRFFQAYVSLFVVGLGSIMFHTTLMYKYQMADELPMSWGSLVWFYTIGNHYDKPGEQQYNWKPILLFGIANSLFFIFVTQEYPAIFQIYILIITGYAVFKIAQIRNQLSDADPSHHKARVLFRCYVAFGVSGFIFWALDRTQCDKLASLPYGIPNPQFHGWWHVLMAVNCYLGPLFVVYMRGLILERRPVVGLLPFAIPQIEYESPRKVD